MDGLRRPRAVSLASGAGGLDLGFVAAGFELVFAMDFDPAAVATHERNFGPGIARVADLTRLAPEEIPDADVWIAGPPCFPAGTPVLTAAGPVLIEEVRPGDLVLTHNGRYRQVTATMRRPYSGPLVRMGFGYGVREIACTPEHPFLVRRREGRRWGRAADGRRIVRTVFEDPAWIEAKDVRPGDLALMPSVREPHEGFVARKARIDSAGSWIPVESIALTEPVSLDVHNLAVEEDESYAVGDGVAVHNCQPFSVAGKRGGAFDNRDMWPHVLRLLEAKLPPFAVFENVPGMLSWNNGTYVREIEGRFRALGYRFTRAVLDAADFGVPQHRRRVVWLLSRVGPPPEPPEPTHGDPRGLAQAGLFSSQRRPWVTVRQALGLGGALSDQWAEGRAAAPWYGTDRPSRTQSTRPQRHAPPSPLDAPSPAVSAVESKGASPADVRRAAEGRARKASSVLGLLDEDDALRVIAQRNARAPGHGDGAVLDEPSVAICAGGSVELVTPAIDAGGWHHAAPRIRSHSAGHGDGADLDSPSVTVAADRGLELTVRSKVAVRAPDLDAPAPTLQVDARVSAPGHHGPGMPRMAPGVIPVPDPGGALPDDPAHTLDHAGGPRRRELRDAPGSQGGAAMRLRRLTVRECARLQSFPDWFEFTGSTSARYRQVGNAVPPLLAWHLANAVRRAMGLVPVPVPDALEWFASRPLVADGWVTPDGRR